MAQDIGGIDAAQLIAEADGGKLNMRVTAALRDVARAVDELGHAGSITLTIGIRREGPVAAVTFKLGAKKPQEPTREQVYFFGPNGLQVEDPRQTSIKFKPPRLTRLDDDSHE